MYPYKIGDKITYAHTNKEHGVTHYLEGEVVFIDYQENNEDEATFLVFNEKQFHQYKRSSEYSGEFYEPCELPLAKEYLEHTDDLIRAKYGEKVKYTWGRMEHIEISSESSLTHILDDLEREVC